MDEKEKESLCTNLLLDSYNLGKTVFLFYKMLPRYIAFVQTFQLYQFSTDDFIPVLSKK